jgi:hypothetical protein
MYFTIISLSCFAVICLAAPALAQSRAVTLEELRQALAPGDHVSLVRTDAEPLTGQLVQVGDRELRIIVPSKSEQPRLQLDVTIPYEEVLSLDRRRDPSRNGALIGAAIGAGFVGTLFGVGVTIDRNEIDEWGPIYLGYGVVFTGAGALVGWAIDRAHSKPAVRYDKSSGQTTMIRVVPLGFRGRGVALSVSF